MSWNLVTIGESPRLPFCRICNKQMPANEAKAKLAPDPEQAKFFYYYHIACLAKELRLAGKALDRALERQS